MTIIRLAATNDRNGNPRRCFVVVGGEREGEVFDEGYEGVGAIPKDLRLLWNGITFETTPAEYRRLVR